MWREDLEVVSKIRPGTAVLATAPNFPYISHMRHFATRADASDRYARYFEDCSVAVIRGVQENTVFLPHEEGEGL